MISNVHAVRIQSLYISNNPLKNNVLAPLKRLSSLTIIPSRHTRKHIQSYAFNASNIKNLTLADANFKFRHQTFDPDITFRFCPWFHTPIIYIIQQSDIRFQHCNPNAWNTSTVKGTRTI